MKSSRNIRLIVTDVDGVWTDGMITYLGADREIKSFNVRDGLAVKIAQEAGIEVAVVTSRRSRALERRCRELGVQRIVQGVHKKRKGLYAVAEETLIPLEDICYLGDDLPDLAAMKLVGLSAAPADAAAEVLDAADWVLDTRGGSGVIRELVERILKERELWAEVVRRIQE